MRCLPSPATGSTVLTDRNISALAADSMGRLWVGYFDRGLDLLPADGPVTHIEDEHVFCVNRILADAKTGTIDVATANGLVRFDNSGSEQQVLTRADGLIADHVTDVAAYRDGLALATPAGLTFLDASGARSMYAFHGLVNNHVYALGVSGDELMAGTLGGLSMLNKGDVTANYTTTSSNLKHNWITAVVPVGSEWMVGRRRTSLRSPLLTAISTSARITVWSASQSKSCIYEKTFLAGPYYCYFDRNCHAALWRRRHPHPARQAATQRRHPLTRRNGDHRPH